ncbi:hypothetical protein Taro_056829, partial [Colocasia esculenta]|nr:hypothetical protein [Colocasia esculenta]
AATAAVAGDGGSAPGRRRRHTRVAAAARRPTAAGASTGGGGWRRCRRWRLRPAKATAHRPAATPLGARGGRCRPQQGQRRARPPSPCSTISGVRGVGIGGKCWHRPERGQQPATQVLPTCCWLAVYTLQKFGM